jgi:hypothetical protein
MSEQGYTNNRRRHGIMLRCALNHEDNDRFISQLLQWITLVATLMLKLRGYMDMFCCGPILVET